MTIDGKENVQLAAIRGGMGEVVAWGVLCDGKITSATVERYDLRHGCEWVPLCDQRITAAMAAEVERLKKDRDDCLSARLLYAEKLGEAMAERNALRAELAEVKGREAVPVGWALTLPDGRVTLEKAYPRWIDGDMGGDGYSAAPLYTTPPASPDVEGLVKALEEVERRNDNPARFDAEIDYIVTAALSTWRKAQESDPCKK